MKLEDDINKRRKGLSRRDAIKRMGQGILGVSVFSLYGNTSLGNNDTVSKNLNKIEPVFIGDKKDLTKLFKKKVADYPDFTVFKNVNIIPMNSEEILKGYDVVINKKTIADFGKTGEVKVPEGKSAFTIDCTGKYLMPGLADMHTHMFNKDDLLLFIANGITTTRCMNGNESVLSYRKEQNHGDILSPKIYSSSPTIADDDLLDNLTMDGDIDDSGFDFVFEPEEAKEAVIYYKLIGYDYIKIFDPLKKSLYTTIMKESKNYNIRVVGHVPIGVDPIAAKQYSIEHFLNDYLQEPGNLESVAKSDVWVCPTLYVYNVKNSKSKELDVNLKYASKRLKKEWIRWNNFYTAKDFKGFEKIGEFVKMGGKLIAGTDCRMQHVIHGFSLHKELEIYVKYGVSPFNALKSATVNAADYLGLLSTTGTIEKGKKADLLLLGANPLEQIKNTQKIEGVMADGQWIDKKGLTAILQKVEEARI